MKRCAEYAIIGFAGGIYYLLLEILWRGYSHPAMIAVGGASLVAIYALNNKLKRVGLLGKSIIGAFIITACELVSGAVINLWLGWNVWDYSVLKYHVLGQISLRTSLLWLALCIPALMVCSIAKEIFELEGESCGK